MRQGIQLTGHDISLAMKRIYDSATDIVKLNSCTSCCRHTDAVPHPSQSAPRAERPMFQHPVYTPRTAAPPPPSPPVFTTGPSYSSWRPTGDVAGSSSQVPRMAPGSEMDDYDYDDEEVSGHSERYGRRSPTPFDLDAYVAEGQHDTLRPSQLSGAPPMTQPSQQYDDTPTPAGGRPTRQVVPPSPLTYSAGHVRAGRKAPKPGTVRGVPPKRGRH
ncbi:hypothetical protein EJB05_16338 [Eragrostis curvula]|uniref:Uncharacterized protein n=1 Tax=Eragrostis curvula TaxID=38414 RepID=A0A5J9VEM9_9POAL|nr:hypothetical protein EJB05_16338 [Eragrostis curvula]